MSDEFERLAFVRLANEVKIRREQVLDLRRQVDDLKLAVAHADLLSTELWGERNRRDLPAHLKAYHDAYREVRARLQL